MTENANFMTEDAIGDKSSCKYPYGPVQLDPGARISAAGSRGGD